VRFLRWGLLAFLLLISFRIPLFLKNLSRGFHLTRLDVSHRVEIWQANRSKLESEFVNPPLDEQTKSILSQPFTYLGRGAQCYAFESRDGQYVIKIFHENREIFPFYAWKKMFREKKSRPRHVLKGTDFEACILAYELAKEDTALVYIHILPTENELPRLFIRDPLGRPFKIALDRYVFVLQKKLKPFRSALILASQRGDLRSYLSSFFSLIESRTAKGIRNADSRLEPNFGFLGDRAIELDFGRYVKQPDISSSELQAVEREKFIGELRRFMQIELPHELVTFEKTLAEFRAQT